MKKIVHQLLQFFTEDVSVLQLLLVMLMMGGLIWWNYAGGGESLLYSKYRRQAPMFFLQWLLYAFVFIGAFLIQAMIKQDFSLFQKTELLLVLFVAPLLFAFQQYFFWHRAHIESNYSGTVASHYGIIAEYVVRSILLLLPVAAYMIFYKSSHQMGWLFSADRVDYKAYFILLLCMVPLVWLAAQQASFQLVYPKMKHALEMSGNRSWNVALFQTSYSLNFVAVESFFRGFLVIALIPIVGKDAILPMAAFYCSIHFGKPTAECISSFAGGLILGVVAYYSQSIVGGIIVHLGIAWLMEIFGMVYK